MDASISQLCKSFTQFHYQTRKLSELNKDLIEFNQIFSSFLLGLQLTAECLSVPPQQSPLKVEDEIEEKDCVVASLSLSPRTSLVKQGATKTQVKPSVSVPMMEAVEVKCQEVKSSARATPRIPSKVPYKPSSSQGGNRKDNPTTILKRIMLALPLHLRETSHQKEMQVLCDYLYSKPDGTFLSDIYLACKSVDKHHVMQFLNLLVKSGDIVKQSRKGLSYQLNPEKYHI